MAAQEEPSQLTADGCHVALTHDHLSATAIMDLVRSPSAGAIVLFAGPSLSPPLLPLPLF